MAYTPSTENPGCGPSFTEDRGGANTSVPARAKPPRSAEEMEKALISIRQARDTLIARNLELSSKLAVAEDRISELDYEREAADQSRDAALQLVQELSRQSDELRERLLALTDENARLESAKREAEQAAPAERSTAALTGQGDTAEIEELRRKVADFAEMGELIRTQHAKHASTLSEQLAAAHRARDIAVAAVTNAQMQVESLASERRGLRTQVESEKATFEARIALLQSQLQTWAASSSVPAAKPPSEASLVDPLACVVSADASMAAAQIRSCVESLIADPANRATLEELDERFHGYAANAGGVGHAGIARFSSTCGELTRWLCKTPRKVAATLPALRDAADLLSDLSGGHPERIADPAGALVYSVDDDPDNCECIAMSLEKMSLRTRYAMKPEIALAELSKSACDIIILDVDLPGMDGFELSERIRATEKHRDTPIIFLSGLISTKERLASLPGGCHAFIPKPYNLNELGVTVLGMILKARHAKAAGTAISPAV